MDTPLFHFHHKHTHPLLEELIPVKPQFLCTPLFQGNTEIVGRTSMFGFGCYILLGKKEADIPPLCEKPQAGHIHAGTDTRICLVTLTSIHTAALNL